MKDTGHTIQTTDGGVTVRTTLWGPLTAERLATEIANHAHRVDQLKPQPKVEFERDPEDYDE